MKPLHPLLIVFIYYMIGTVPTAIILIFGVGPNYEVNPYVIIPAMLSGVIAVAVFADKLRCPRCKELIDYRSGKWLNGQRLWVFYCWHCGWWMTRRYDPDKHGPYPPEGEDTAQTNQDGGQE